MNTAVKRDECGSKEETALTANNGVCSVVHHQRHSMHLVVSATWRGMSVRHGRVGFGLQVRASWMDCAIVGIDALVCCSIQQKVRAIVSWLLLRTVMLTLRIHSVQSKYWKSHWSKPASSGKMGKCRQGVLANHLAQQSGGMEVV